MNAPRLHLDYVAAPRPPRLLGLLVLAAALAAAGVLVERYREARLALERIDASQGLLGAAQPVRALPRDRLQDEAKGAGAVLRQLALPWSAIIATVESVASPDVAVLQLQPDAQQRQLRLVAAARTQETMLDYVRSLAAAETLADPHVVNHQVRTDEPGRPVQFTVQAALRGPP